jgi:hypothetical protein
MTDQIAVNIDWTWVRGQVLAKEHIPTGGKSDTKISLTDAVDDCLRIATHLAKPRMATAKKEILDTDEKTVRLEGPLSLSGPSLSSHVRGSSHACLFLVTIGSDLEETATMLMESGEQLHGYLLDRVGSFAVESLAEAMEGELRRIHGSRDMSVSTRFSPGYCDWPIEEQLKLEKAIEFSRAGVRLTESCMMIPRKSISGLVGIGPKGLFSASKSQCDICNRKACDYKRVTAGDSGS